MATKIIVPFSRPRRWQPARAGSIPTYTHSLMGPFCAPGPAADLMVNDRNVVRFSLASQPDSTPVATLATCTTPATASPASIVSSGVDAAPAVTPFDLEKALNFLEKLSDIELRSVMRMLHAVRKKSW